MAQINAAYIAFNEEEKAIKLALNLLAGWALGEMPSNGADFRAALFWA